MIKLLAKFGLILIVGLFIGCSSSSTMQEGAPIAVGKSGKPYAIGVGDVLSINVWRNEELTMAMPVRPDGKISMPLVGDTQASGLTVSELSESLRSSLVNYIRNPQVTVIVNSAASTDYQSRVRVTGAIDTPISIPYREGMTVLDVVLESGGLTEFARGNGAKLFRKSDDGSVQTYPVRLTDILNRGDLRTNYPLAPSDIITVPERLF